MNKLKMMSLDSNNKIYLMIDYYKKIDGVINIINKNAQKGIQFEDCPLLYSGLKKKLQSLTVIAKRIRSCINYDTCHDSYIHGNYEHLRRFDEKIEDAENIILFIRTLENQ